MKLSLFKILEPNQDVWCIGTVTVLFSKGEFSQYICHKMYQSLLTLSLQHTLYCVSHSLFFSGSGIPPDGDWANSSLKTSKNFGLGFAIFISSYFNEVDDLSKRSEDSQIQLLRWGSVMQWTIRSALERLCHFHAKCWWKETVDIAGG